jgi:hypothetical protein
VQQPERSVGVCQALLQLALSTAIVTLPSDSSCRIEDWRLYGVARPWLVADCMTSDLSCTACMCSLADCRALVTGTTCDTSAGPSRFVKCTASSCDIDQLPLCIRESVIYTVSMAQYKCDRYWRTSRGAVAVCAQLKAQPRVCMGIPPSGSRPPGEGKRRHQSLLP